MSGVLSLSNYEHLPAIPLSELEGNKELVERCLMTIIRKREPISFKEILEEFNSIYKVEFEQLRVGDLTSFITHRNQLFSQEDDHRLR